jgi:hypothetical protein
MRERERREKKVTVAAASTVGSYSRVSFLCSISLGLRGEEALLAEEAAEHEGTSLAI